MSIGSLRLENSIVSGCLVDDPGTDHHDLAFDAYLDGTFRGSGSPIFPRIDASSGALEPTGAFRIRVPDAPRERLVLVEIRDRSSDDLLARQELVQHPTLSPHGLQAATIMELHRAPLASVDGFALSGGNLYVTGLVLAPAGDPRCVSLSVDGEIAYEFTYPLPHPSAKDVYWYWPNSDFSTYKLDIDLARTQHIGDAYSVMFSFEGGDVAKHRDLKNTVWIPKDLGAYQNYPSYDNLRRVQRYDNISGVTIRGYSDCRRLWEIAARYGLDRTGAKVLDWGVGHGRVLRHLRSLDPSARASGIDIDAENVSWMRDNLPWISAVHGPLMPPTPYADGEFDLIWGISVMTHLTRSVQEAWLAEIRRILRPGGLALLTFAGDTAVAFTSRFLSREWLDEYRSSGRGPDLPSDDLVGKISDPTYYRNVNISPAQVANLCDPYFDVLDVLECMFGYQDLAVLRKAPR